jgi:DNA-3-methyladenine glycosylase II
MVRPATPRSAAIRQASWGSRVQSPVNNSRLQVREPSGDGWKAASSPSRPRPTSAAPDADLRAAGLSRAKIATLRGVAEALLSGTLDLQALAEAPDDVVHAELTALKGIGPWTADIYLMFCLGRADAWSPGDLALQLAVKDALQLDGRPRATEMVEIAEVWRPWRGVAARMLWAYYALRKAGAVPK